MSHPFPIITTGVQPLPIFLEKTRFTLEEIRKDPFKLTRHRSRLKPAKKEERINSAVIVSVDITQCRQIQASMREICRELDWKAWTIPRQLGRCDIYLQGHQIESFDQFADGGAVNKFPKMADILKKINLTRSLSNLQMMFPEDYTFFPRTWFLPKQYHEFCADVAILKRQKKKGARPKYYIVKPDNGTQGDGIYLIKDPHDYQLTPKGCHVVQEYIAQPFLLEKMKFDLRVYVVLLSLDPMKIYLSREGLARFCTVPYKEPTMKNVHETYMHLTNYSLNKYNDTFIHTDRLTDGSKRTITSALIQLAKLGHDTCKIWSDIEELVIKTMLAITPELKIAHKLAIQPGSKASCFQILGFDILLTESLEPILLEVNANPSLYMMHERPVGPGIFEEVPSKVDKHIKKNLIKETMILAAPRSKVAHLALPSDTNTEGIEPMTGYESLFAEEAHPHNFLYEIYPGNYQAMFSKLRILERLSELYQKTLALHETAMSANSFRLFARKCCLVHQNTSLTVAALDILFIEVQRRYNDDPAEAQTNGLTFPAFLEAFLIIGNRSKLKSENIYQMVDNMLHYCEANLEMSSLTQLRRAKLPRVPVRVPARYKYSRNLISSAKIHTKEASDSPG